AKNGEARGVPPGGGPRDEGVRSQLAARLSRTRLQPIDANPEQLATPCSWCPPVRAVVDWRRCSVPLDQEEIHFVRQSDRSRESGESNASGSRSHGLSNR